MYFNQNSDAGLSWTGPAKLPDTRSSWFRSMILLITGKAQTMSNHQSTYPQTSSHLNTAQFHQKVQCGEYHVLLLLNLIIKSIFSISCFVLDLQIFSPVCDSTPVIRQNIFRLFMSEQTRGGRVSNVWIQISQLSSLWKVSGGGSEGSVEVLQLKFRCQG